jgi:hypothetical protein
MCCGGGAPAPDPAIGQAAAANAKVSADALDFYKGIYNNDIAPREAADQALRTRLTDSMTANMDQQTKIGAEQYQRYKDIYAPVEDQSAKDAMNYDSQDNIQRRSGIAAADVNQQFSNAAGQNARLLSRYGLNPNSSAFAQTNAQLTNQQALASAGAETGAAFDTMDKAIALRAGAAQTGRGLTNTALGAFSGATNTGSAAGNVSAQGMGVAAQGAGVMGQGFNTAISGNQSAGNLYLGQYGAQMQGYAADQAAIGGLFQGLGMAAGASKGFGFFKDGGHIDVRGLRMEHGGKVDGPGGPIDDKVPAMLSDGEYVIPADVVKAKGVEFFDKLKEKYHTPAVLQRRGIGRA